MKFTVTQIITGLGVVAAIWAILFGKGLLEYLPKGNRFQLNNARIFLIEVDQNIYQIGIVTKLINLTDENKEIDFMVIKDGELGVVSRVKDYIQVFYNRVCYPEIQDDDVVIANSPAYLKLLTPIKIQLINDSVRIPPEIVLIGKWCIRTKSGLCKTTYGNMKYYATYDKYITTSEWNNLLKPSSNINIETIPLKLAPVNVDLTLPTKRYLLWNRDPSAKINVYGFTESVYVKSSNGTMVFVAGNGNINLENGWEMLGNSYREVWSNHQKLMIYNSIYPPFESGEPRAFAAFMGSEEEMGVNDAVPTTRAGTFLHIPLLDPFKWKKGKTRGQENVSFIGTHP